ncbi:PEGA domain-containing protein [Aeoliella mucimassa]|uniref:PEGA domain protein n=1 Tax=Aeoliella mucimassa TaxID=2527972 RepID=A0A518AJ16_9BACT|nr:PEGA domain-containing protein [Aeoliella mucimassa]QDU54722.1 PEGA domain protein [Aeoliella mucimassa]
MPTSIPTATRNRSPNRYQAIAIGMLVLLSATGCVRRRLTVRSNPPGALVYVDNQQVGTTPCSVDFTYYGTRELRLVKSGYETLTVNQPIPTPWYQYPPLDFFSDNFAMTKIRDNRTTAVFELQPQTMLPVEEIIRRGEELRGRAQSGAVMPAANNVVIPPPPTPTTTFP